MRYGIYIFDFDYTLGDATGGIVEAVYYALNTMNLPLPTRDEVRQSVGMSLQDTFVYLAKNKEPEAGALFVRLFRKKADEIMTQNTVLFKDTVRVLSHLKSEGARLGIVTTKYRYRIVEILDKFQISGLFDVIVGGEDVKNTKPDPEALIRAIQLFDSPKGNAVYIGDSLIDAKTAGSVNMDFIAVTMGTTKREEFMRLPHIAIIGSLSELAAQDPPVYSQTDI